MHSHIVGHESLERIDRHRLIDIPAVTYPLARVVANPAADRGQWIPLPDQVQSLLELAGGDEGHVPLAVYVCRTGQHAGRSVQLRDGGGGGDGRRGWFSAAF